MCPRCTTDELKELKESSLSSPPPQTSCVSRTSPRVPWCCPHVSPPMSILRCGTHSCDAVPTPAMRYPLLRTSLCDAVLLYLRRTKLQKGSSRCPVTECTWDTECTCVIECTWDTECTCVTECTWDTECSWDPVLRPGASINPGSIPKLSFTCPDLGPQSKGFPAHRAHAEGGHVSPAAHRVGEG